jgi:hypothetical protein
MVDGQELQKKRQGEPAKARQWVREIDPLYIIVRFNETMPATYAIDSKQQLVTSRLWGAVTEDEVHDHNRRLRSDPAFVPSYRQLVDMTGITEIKVGTNLINQTSLDQFFAPGTRRAFIASSDAAFGMARMFALRAEGLGQVIEVFRDPDKGKDWLGL